MIKLLRLSFIFPLLSLIIINTNVSVAQSGVCCPFVGWNYVMPISFTNQSGAAITNLQIPFFVNTSTPISQGKMKSDGSDIRFYINCGQYLDYWIESGINTANTKIWIRVPNVANGATVTIFMNYGNASATAVSNQALLFPNVVNLNGGNISGTTNADWINVTGNVTMAQGQPVVLNARKINFNATFNGVGLGFGGQAGPGAGGNGNGSIGGGGGGYGGAGGRGGGNNNGGATYGTANGTDINMGSGGGGSDCPPTGSGGGAITLNGCDVDVNGSINVSGRNANNCTGNPSNEEAAAGGSGGGILIQGDYVSGNATLTANGGNGGNSSTKEGGGGGGGGRIKIFWCKQNGFSGTQSVAGGNPGSGSQSGMQPGAAGTTFAGQTNCYTITPQAEQPVSIPVASFTTSPVCLGSATTFTNTSTSAPVSTTLSSDWSFGDATSSTQNSPSKTYAAAGNYTVTLTVTSATGCIATSSQQITVNNNPVANFNSTTVCENNPVNFTDASTGNPTQWNWDFGGGNFSNNQNPSFTFNSSGSFSVSLTVTNANGCTNSTSKNVTVNPGVRADFTFNSDCVGKSIQFNNTSSATTGNILSNFWLFGDGNSSNNPSPSNAYSTAGTYNVQLIIQGSNGCGDTVLKQVEVYPKPVANFVVRDTCKGFPSQFFDASTISSGVITQWGWNFGNGVTSTLQNPVRTFPTDGSFNVSLIVYSDKNCFDTITKVATVNPKPTADFVVPAVCFPNAAQFTDGSLTASGSITQWQWAFGDGNFSSLQNPVHNYGSAGIYNVSLVSSTDKGCSDTILKQVQVYHKPAADFTVSDVCNKQISSFSDISTVQNSTITSTNWDFGDGNNSTLANPQHYYSNAGVYNVSLIVTSSNGCKDTVTKSATVYPTPITDFSANNVCLGGTVSFIDNSTISSGNIASWNWNFNDGNISSDQNPSHTFSNQGSFVVRLVTTSDMNCRDTIDKSVSVFPLPNVNFSAGSVCENSATVFTDNSSVASGSITSWNWSFGDGNVSTLQSPTNTYVTQGNYDVKLIVITDQNCSDSIVKPVTVYTNPVASFINDSVCLNNPTSFSSTSTISNGSIQSYIWNFGDGNTSAAQNPSHTFSNSGVFNVSLEVTSDQGCLAVANDIAVVYPEPQVAFTANEVCLGNAMNFNNQSIISSGAITAYNWDFGDGSGSSQVESPTYLFNAEGSYNVSLSAISDKNCSSSFSKLVNVNSNPTISLVSTSACYDEANGTATAIASGGNGAYSYLWSNGRETSVIDNLAAGSYSVTVVDGNNCSVTGLVSVTQPAEPLVVSSDEEIYSILPGEKATISLSANYADVSFAVSPSNFLSCASCSTFTAQPLKTFTYNVVATDTQGCKGVTEFTVYVKDEFPLYIPNTFSPNGDGVNDFFEVFSTAVKLFEIKIFNRWGEKVFESDNIQKGWDGYFLGQQAQAGVYVYELSVTYLNNKTEKRRGSLSLIK